MADKKSTRLVSLDLLRGLDIFFLTALWAPLYFCLEKWAYGSPAFLFIDHQLTSFVTPGSALYGYNIKDLAQPLFVFVCGAAVSFAIPKRLTADGRATGAFWKHVLWRFAVLWTLGCLIRNVLTFDLSKFTPYSDTLHTIAVAYLGASLAQLIRHRWIRATLALSAILIYGVVQHAFGDYTRLGNISRIVDEAVFGAIGCKAKDYCYVLTTVPWAAMGIIGSLCADMLRSDMGEWGKASALALSGAGSLLFGHILGIWVPMIRYIYTVSFIFASLGWSLLLFALIFVLADIWQIRKGTGILLLFGQCSLAAWMLSNFFVCGIDAVVRNCIRGAVAILGGNGYDNVLLGFGRCAFTVILVAMWRRYKVLKNRCKGNANEKSSS